MLKSACARWRWGGGAEVASALRAGNVSIIWSGNSIRRHIFFRFSGLLGGGARAQGADSDYGFVSREGEKAACRKNVDVPSDFRYDKPGCGDSCCGACSCMSDSGGVPQYFVWQQEWFDEQLERVWNALVAIEAAKDKNRRVFIIMNAGLIWAWQKSERSLPLLVEQFQGLRRWLEQLPDSVRVIYTGSTSTKSVEQNMWMNGQDGVMRVLLETVSSEKRPAFVSMRELSADLLDFVDPNHFTGRTADALIDSVMHVLLAAAAPR